jgi:hypothetical protein
VIGPFIALRGGASKIIFISRAISLMRASCMAVKLECNPHMSLNTFRSLPLIGAIQTSPFLRCILPRPGAPGFIRRPQVVEFLKHLLRHLDCKLVLSRVPGHEVVESRGLGDSGAWKMLFQYSKCPVTVYQDLHAGSPFCGHLLTRSTALCLGIILERVSLCTDSHRRALPSSPLPRFLPA